jgi:hypothetical protein
MTLQTAVPRSRAGASRRRALAACVVLAGALGHAGAAQAAGPDAVTTWNENAGDAALAACIAPFSNPLHESRMYAMTHVAIHDALNAIDRRSEPYALDLRAPRSASPDAAVAAAAHDVLVPLVGELPEPSPPKPVVTRGSRASRLTTRRRWARSPTGRPSGGESSSAARRPQRSLRCAQRTAVTHRR